MRRIAGQDTTFLSAETDTWAMNVSALLILRPDDEQCTVDRLRETFLSRLPTVHQFRWKVREVLGGWQRPVWVEAAGFDPASHVFVTQLPPPCGDAELDEMFASIVAAKLRRDEPLWELWIVGGLSGGRLAVIFKAHHALTDGISGMELAQLLLDIEPDAPLAVESDPPAETSAAETARDVVVDLVRAPLDLARFAVNVGRSARAMLDDVRSSDRAAMPVIDAPSVPFDGPISPRRRFASSSVGFEQLQRVRKAYGVTVNDVLLAMCAGGLRSYLTEHGGVPDRALVAAAPLSVRSAEEQHDPGSRVAWLFVSVPSHLEDARARVEAAHESAAKAKRLRTELAHRLHGPKLGEILPPITMRMMARAGAAIGFGDWLPPAINLLVSNVPGPPVQLYCGGALVEAIYPIGPLMMGYGLNVTAVSYADRFDIGVLSCPTKVAEPAEIADRIAAELDLLEADAFGHVRHRGDAPDRHHVVDLAAIRGDVSLRETRIGPRTRPTSWSS